MMPAFIVQMNKIEAIKFLYNNKSKRASVTLSLEGKSQYSPRNNVVRAQTITRAYKTITPLLINRILWGILDHK